MIILKTLYISPMVDLSYIFHRFREILRNEYNSFWEDCSFVDNKYIIYQPTDLKRVKLSFISNYPPTKTILGFKCNNSSYYLSNPNDADISGVVHLFINDCEHYEYQHIINTIDVYDHILSRKKPSLTKVISSDPATIAFWDDGTKTVVKCQEGDTYDEEKGILYAVLHKCISDNKDYHNFLKEMERFKTLVEDMKIKGERE